MGLLQSLKGYVVEVAIGKVKERLDGREITRRLDAAIDAQLGDKSSEKVQRGPVWEFIKELAEGLYEEDRKELRMRLAEWIRELKED